MNGPSIFSRPGEIGPPRETVAVDRPLTETIESNRGGFAILHPPRVISGTSFGENKNLSVDLRTKYSSGERYAVSLGIGIDPGIDKNNSPRQHRAKASCFDFLESSGAASFVWPRVTARFEWGTGSAAFAAEVDVVNGSVVSVPAETLRVSARYDVDLPKFLELPDRCIALPVYRVQACVSYGQQGKRPPTLTRLVALAASGDAVDVAIPMFATAVTLLPVSGSSVSATTFGLGMGLSVDVLSRVQQVLQNGDAFVRVANTSSPSAPAYAFLVFELSL
jgi:hypothetical protein